MISRADRIRLNIQKFREGGISYPVTWAKKRIAWEIKKRKAVEFETSTTEFHNEAIRAGFIAAITSAGKSHSANSGPAGPKGSSVQSSSAV